MVNRKETLSIRCQCKLVSVNLGGFYYKPLVARLKKISGS